MMFDDFEIVHVYTEDQAIEDGVLVHPYPDRWPWLLITQGVHAICNDSSRDKRTYEQKLAPLLVDCILAVKGRTKADAPIVLNDTVCGTVWIMPNGKGGMTVLLPHEN